ncbi:PREDICTED: uncharacterized protein LOC108619146 [Drosophila arizonae]|uniref:Uncharacterized protein LOC108619146 n=1 Tax=Drosophila arizonae TaxID=7263 RepID=A0ABM1PUW7_DROAR|nr:PREDICTED: uncharacterized protein LOC108619146 [Drosophila arizonae]
MKKSYYSQSKKSKNTCKERLDCQKMAGLGLESTDESTLSGHIDSISKSLSQSFSMSLSETPSCYKQYRKRPDCEKSTQTLVFACPRCSREFGSIQTSESQSDSSSSQQQTEDQLEQSSGRTEMTGLTMDMPSPPKPLSAKSSKQLSIKEPKSTNTEHASDYKPRCDGKPPRYPQPINKEIPMDYHKQSTSRKSKSKMAKVLQSPVSEGSLQKLGGKHMYDFPDNGYVSPAATEPCGPLDLRKQKPPQSFRTVATETSLQSIADKLPKESEHKEFAVPLPKHQTSQHVRKQTQYTPDDVDLHAAQASRVTKKGRNPSRNMEQETKSSAASMKESTEIKPPTKVHTCKTSKAAQTQSKSRHGRHGNKNSQLAIARRAKEATAESNELRNKIVDDLIYYKSLHEGNSTSSGSSSMLRSINDDMTKLFDLYATTTPSETTESPTSGSKTESPKPSCVKERHHLPSLGLPSPAQPKQEERKLSKAEEKVRDALRQGPKIMNMLNLTPQDLIDTHVTAPMIRRVQRIYRANLAEQMMLVQELDSIPKLVREMLQKLQQK